MLNTHNLEIIERRVIEKVLEITKGNKARTAELLKMGRTSLYEKIKKYNIALDIPTLQMEKIALQNNEKAKAPVALEKFKNITEVGNSRGEMLYNLKSIEKFIISKTLLQTRYNKMETATLLGIGRTTLYEKIKEHDINEVLNISFLDLNFPDFNTVNLKEVEKATIEKALLDTRWKKTKTAELLGIGRTTLYEKIKKYNL